MMSISEIKDALRNAGRPNALWCRSQPAGAIRGLRLRRPRPGDLWVFDGAFGPSALREVTHVVVLRWAGPRLVEWASRSLRTGRILSRDLMREEDFLSAAGCCVKIPPVLILAGFVKVSSEAGVYSAEAGGRAGA